MKPFLPVIALSFLLCAPCVAQEDTAITTDRPTVGSGPELVPIRSLETENGLGWTNDDRRSRFDLPETLVRYGVEDRIEARILLPDTHLSGGDPAQTDDLQFGVKLKFRPEGALWPMALASMISAPTGSDGLSSGGWDPYETFSISHPFSRRYSSFATLIAAAVSSDSPGRRLFTQAAIEMGYAFAPRHTLFVEYAPLYDGRQHTGGYAVDTGTTWTARQNLQLDLKIGRTVVGDSRGFNLALGYSIRRHLGPPVPSDSH